MKENNIEHNKEEKVVRVLTGRDLMALPEIEWLWRGYIPLGLITLVVGQPGSGKSAFAQDLAHRLAQGKIFLDGSLIVESSKTLWIDAEGAKGILGQRVKDWGMDPDQFILPHQGEIYGDFNLNPISRDLIESTLEEYAPKLVVIDALTGIHSGDEKVAKDMKGVLDQLQLWASKFNCAVIVVHHLNKGDVRFNKDLITLDRVRGSTQIGASARSVLAIDDLVADGCGSAIGDSPDKRVYQIKNTLGKLEADPIHFKITGKGVVCTDRSRTTPRRIESQKEKAMRIIMEALGKSKEPIPATMMMAMLVEEGIPESTWKRAKEELPVRSFKKVGVGESKAQWFWVIEEDEE